MERVMTATGVEYEVTVSYTKGAGIPLGAELKVREIEKGSPEYEKYLDAAKESVGGRVVDAGFLDIEIEKDGVKIEPKKPVMVEIRKVTQADEGTTLVMAGVDEETLQEDTDDLVEEEALHPSTVSIFHFQDEDDSELIENVVSNEEMMVFQADSFSVYGIVYTVTLSDTVITNTGDEYEITVTFDQSTGIPEDAELRVSQILEDDEKYLSLCEKADEKLREENGYGLEDPVLFNIGLYVDGVEVEPIPGSQVKVEVKLSKSLFHNRYGEEHSSILVNETPLAWIKDAINETIEFVHNKHNGEAEIISSDYQIDDPVINASFQTESFSDWLLSLDQKEKNFTIYVGDELTLRPYDEWIWKKRDDANMATWDFSNWTANGTYTYTYDNNQTRTGYRYKDSAGVIEFYSKEKHDGELNEDYTLYYGTANKAGTIVLQQKDTNGNISDAFTITVENRPTGYDGKPGILTAADGVVDNTVDGINFNLFKYNTSKTLDVDNNYANKWTNSTTSSFTIPGTSQTSESSVNKGHYLKFLGSGSGNSSWFDVNNYTKDVPTQGIVKDYLEKATDGEFYPVVSNTKSDGTSRTYVTSEENLYYLFNPSANTEEVKAYKDTNGLFMTDENYYFYNSNSNYAEYYYDSTAQENRIKLYESTYTQKGGNGISAKPIGCFPFHEYDSDNDLSVNYTKNLGHHFGVSLDTKFFVPENKDEVTFEFSGDDDMWVFVDDVLLLDVGGIHQPITARIDFKSGKYMVDGVNGNSWSNIADIFTSKGLEWDTGENNVHTLRAFYMERGGCDSNLSIKFNYTIIDKFGDLAFDKIGQQIWEQDHREKLKGVKFCLFMDPDCTTQIYYEGKPFIAESDDNGQIKFTDIPIISNRTPTHAGPDEITYYMKEIETPYPYYLDDTVYEVTVRNKKLEGAAGISTLRRLNDNNSLSDPVLNTVEYTNFEFDKKDDALQPVKDAVFTLYQTYNCENNTLGAIYKKKDGSNAVATADANGKVSFGEIPIWMGTAYMKETTMPNGYLPNNDVYEVHLAKDKDPVITKVGEDETIEDIINIRKQVKIKKVDENGDTLTGAVFTVTRPDNQSEEIEVGADGFLVISNLTNGNYTVTEKTAPTGYDRNTSSIKFNYNGTSITDNSGTLTGVDKDTSIAGIITYTVTNKPTQGNLIVKKRWYDVDGNEYVPEDGEVSVTLKRYKQGTSKHNVRLIIKGYNSANDQTLGPWKTTEYKEVIGDATSITWTDGQLRYGQNLYSLYADDTKVTVNNTSTNVQSGSQISVKGLSNTSSENINITLIYNLATITDWDRWFEGAVKNFSININGGTGNGNAPPEQDLNFIPANFPHVQQTLNSSNNWTYTWKIIGTTDDDENCTYALSDGSKAYLYYVEEYDIPDGFGVTYTPSIDTYSNINTVGSATRTIKNTQKQKNVDMSVKKEWLSGNSVASPSSVSKYKIKLKLYQKELSSKPTSPFVLSRTDDVNADPWTEVGTYVLSSNGTEGLQKLAGEYNVTEIRPWFGKITNLPEAKREGTETKYYVYKLTEDSVSEVTGGEENIIPTSSFSTIIEKSTGGITIKNILGNTEGIELPATGGPGTVIFYTIGALLTALASVMILMKRQTNY